MSSDLAPDYSRFILQEIDVLLDKLYYLEAPSHLDVFKTHIKIFDNLVLNFNYLFTETSDVINAGDYNEFRTQLVSFRKVLGDCTSNKQYRDLVNAKEDLLTVAANIPALYEELSYVNRDPEEIKNLF